jgi:hypothetical protein
VSHPIFSGNLLLGLVMFVSLGQGLMDAWELSTLGQEVKVEGLWGCHMNYFMVGMC